MVRIPLAVDPEPNQTGHSESECALRAIVAQRRFVFHLTTIERLLAIAEREIILPRAKLQNLTGGDYADWTLIRRREDFVLPSGLKLNQAVPFYLTPRQPMFFRLLRLHVVRQSDVVAIGVDMIAHGDKLPHWLFDSNPVYEASQCLGDWQNRHELDWDALAAWPWQSSSENVPGRVPPTWKRQAEVVVEHQVNLGLCEMLLVEDQRSVAALPSDLREKTQPIAKLFDR